MNQRNAQFIQQMAENLSLLNGYTSGIRSTIGNEAATLSKLAEAIAETVPALETLTNITKQLQLADENKNNPIILATLNQQQQSIADLYEVISKIGSNASSMLSHIQENETHTQQIANQVIPQMVVQLQLIQEN